MFSLPISKPRFKSIIFNQNSPKIKLFFSKNAKFSSAGGSAPRPPYLRGLGALPPNPQPPAAGGFAPRPPKQLLHCEFLATRLDHTNSLFYSFVVGLHPTLAKKIGLSLRKDLFFSFCSSPDFGRKIGLNLGGTISYSEFLIFVLLKFSEVPGPPLFKILRTLLSTKFGRFDCSGCQTSTY